MKFILSSLAIASLSVTSTQVFAQEKIITSSPKPEDAKGFYGTLGLGYALLSRHRFGWVNSRAAL